MDRSTHPFFVPASLAGSRHETAVLLVGTAREFDIPQRDIASTYNGYYISEALVAVLQREGALEGSEPVEQPAPEPVEEEVDDWDEADEADEEYFDPADYSAEQVRGFVEENPEAVDDVLAAEQSGKNRKGLVEWLTKTSGDRAAKTNGTNDKE